MTTSVVIPAFNGKQYLSENLPFVVEMGADEIIVVDDASADGTADFVAEKFPNIKLIRHKVNQGFPISVNDGFKEAQGEIVFLLNQDLKPGKGLIKKALIHFQTPDVFAVTFNENGHSWADGKWVGGMLEFTNGKLDAKLHESLWPSGGGSAIRRYVWNALGGFDPIFSPGYFEDLDLGLRAKTAGYKTIWEPQARVDHAVEGTFPKSFPQKKLQYVKERNYLIAVWKNIDSKLWPVHIMSLIKRIITGPGYLVPTILAVARIAIASVVRPNPNTKLSGR